MSQEQVRLCMILGSKTSAKNAELALEMAKASADGAWIILLDSAAALRSDLLNAVSEYGIKVVVLADDGGDGMPSHEVANVMREAARVVVL